MRLQIAMLVLSFVAAASGQPGASRNRMSETYAGESSGISPQDYHQALRFIRLSAGRGDAECQLFLGLIYAAGRGVPADAVESLKWLRLAASQGNEAAQFYLGGLYFSGKLVPLDYVEAYKWFTLAGRSDPTRTSTLEVLARAMTPAELSEARHRIENLTLPESRK